VMIGPGCLMYTLILSLDARPHIRRVDAAHGFVLESLVQTLQVHFPKVIRAGTSDLALADDTPRKFSGNSLRLRSSHVLYHGTLLYDFSLSLVGKYLRAPPREPDYRNERQHRDFLVNLPVSRQLLRDVLVEAFDGHRTSDHWPARTTTRLVASRYSQDNWNLGR